MARNKARELAGEVAAGVDLARRGKERRAMLTLSELFDRYERRCIQEGSRSHVDTRQRMERWVLSIPPEERKPHARARAKPTGSVDWSSRRIDSINRDDVRDFLNRLARRGLGVTCNRIAETISACYNYAREEEGYDVVNPAAGLQPVKETARARFLLAEELPRFLSQLDRTPQPWKDYFGLLLVLGYRRQAVAQMRWEDVNLDLGVWHVPTRLAKNGEAVNLPLVGTSLEILKRRKRESQSEHVFPGRGRRGTLTSPKKQWARLLKEAGLQNLVIHDLRRSLGSWMTICDSSLTKVAKALGHKSMQSTEIYARLDLKSTKEAVSRAQAAMMSFKPEPEKSNVIPLKRGGK
jgi:integrase